MIICVYLYLFLLIVQYRLNVRVPRGCLGLTMIDAVKLILLELHLISDRS